MWLFMPTIFILIQIKFYHWRLPKIEDCMERWSVFVFGPPIIGEKGEDFGQNIGD
jgi:hypothetical protein